MFKVDESSLRVICSLLAMLMLGGCGSGGGSGVAAPAGGGGPANPGAALALAGTPAGQIPVGLSYCFVPTASGSSGAGLTFSIDGKPSWADFDSSTGKLSGRPGSGDVSDNTGIVISVSDGSTTASLPAFGVSVVNSATGSAVLSWTPPTQTVEGKPLADLAGFRVYFGNEQDCYSNSETINNPGIATHVIDNLPEGRWYFTVTAFVSSGIESDQSNVATKTF